MHKQHNTFIKQNPNNTTTSIVKCAGNQKIWVIGDVHGCYQQFMGLVNSPLIGENDIVILIGDIIDRGPDSVKMLDWAMENVNNGGRYYMIRGNHEQNIIDDYTSFSDKQARKNNYRIQAGEQPVDYNEFSIYNLRCQYDFCEYMERANILKVGQALKYIEWMKNLPMYLRVQVPDGKKFVIAHAWFEGKLMDDGAVRPTISDEDILWYRDIDGSDNLCKYDYNPMEDEMLIHGHTPIPAFKERTGKLAEPLYREHSINIDGGCFVGRTYGGRLIALCLNDFRCIYSSL